MKALAVRWLMGASIRIRNAGVKCEKILPGTGRNNQL
jgi:hypothetical protein